MLAIPVFTVASKSTYNTGGCVLNPFKSSLSPKVVESLICTQDWLRLCTTPISVEEDLDHIEQLEEGKLSFTFFFNFSSIFVTLKLFN